MTFELAVLSGKGGTGKTSITAAFAQLEESIVLCDLDVDASNLPLMLQPKTTVSHEFVSGQVARLDEGTCRGCGACIDDCKFGALSEVGPKIVLDTAQCEGCGVCAHFCRPKAIVMEPRTCGEWYQSVTDIGPMLHARLNPGEENSGKLVSTLRQQAKTLAEETSANLILADGPPGIGCPVISSVTGCNGVVCVTEPTASGLHDLQRVCTLSKHFEIPTALIINKYGLNEAITRQLAEYAQDNKLPIVGRIPYSDAVMPAIVNQQSMLDVSDVSDAVRLAWENICQWQPAISSKSV